MASFLGQFLRFIRKDLPHDIQWLVYTVDVDAAAEARFFLDALLSLRSDSLLTVESANDAFASEKAPFIYIGYGDDRGVYRSRGYDFGHLEHFCGRDSIGQFPHYPCIWFANSTAKWLGHKDHGGWFGFSGSIGVHMKTRAERRWWQRAIRRIWKALLLCGQEQVPTTFVEGEMRSLCNEIRTLWSRNQKKYSFLSVALMQSLARSARFGPNFGPS